MQTKKKKFDAVAFMREARAKIERDWAGRPGSEQIDHLKAKRRKRTSAGKSRS